MAVDFEMLGLGVSFTGYADRTGVAPEEALGVYTGALARLNERLDHGESVNEFMSRTGISADEALPAYNVALGAHRARLAHTRGVAAEGLRA